MKIVILSERARKVFYSKLRVVLLVQLYTRKMDLKREDRRLKRTNSSQRFQSKIHTVKRLMVSTKIRGISHI